MTKGLTALFATIITVPALTLPVSAIAGPYVGLGIGGTRTESSLAKLGLPPGLSTDVDAIGADPDFSSSDVAFQAVVGWTITPNIAVEVGYTNFGSARQLYELPDACNALGCQSREWTAQMDLSGYQAFLIGSLPISKTIDAYVKVGAMNWDATYKGLERNRSFVPGFPIAPGNDPVTFDDDGTDFAAGLGVNLKTDSPFSVKVDFTYYDVETTDFVWNLQLLGIYQF